MYPFIKACAVLALCMGLCGPAARLAADGRDLGQYERDAEMNPQDPQVQFNLGVMCLKAKDFARAAKALKKATALAPKDAEAWEAYGTALMALKQQEPALQALTQATSLDGRRAGAWAKLAALLSLEPSKDSLNRAVEAFGRAAELAPGDARLVLNQGLLLAKLDQDKRAESVLLKASRMEGGQAAFKALCVLYNKAGNASKAAEACRHATEADPSQAESWYNLGFALQRQDKNQDAREAYRHAVDLDPSHAPALYALAFLDFQAGDAAKALAGFEAAMKARNGDYPEAEYNAAVLLGDQGRYEDAADLYRTLLRSDPGNQDAKNNLQSVVEVGSTALLEQGKDSYERGDFDAARKAWARARKLDPSNEEAGRLLGQVEAKNNAAEKEAAAARKAASLAVARRLKAEDAKVRQRGMAAFKAGTYAEAVRLLDFYLKKNPEDSSAQTVLVKARGRMRAATDDLLRQAAGALQSGNRDEASALASRVLSQDPGNARARSLQRQAGEAPAPKKIDQEGVRKLYYYGVEQYLAGDLAGAVGTWKKVLSQEPDHLDAQRSLSRAELELDELRKRGKT